MDTKPSLGQRWRNYHPTKGILIWACLGSIALTLLIGFNWGGWQTTAGAERRSQTMVNAALVERLAPICLDQFNQDPDKAAKVVAMEGMTSGETTAYIQEQGWATFSGVENPDRKVAAACTKLLLASSQ